MFWLGRVLPERARGAEVERGLESGVPGQIGAVVPGDRPAQMIRKVAV